MKKLHNNSIVLSLGILAVSACTTLALPMSASAQNGTTTFTTYMSSPSYDYETPQPNPSPIIDSINPNSNARYPGAQTVTIIGNGFVPESVARVNSANRLTTFVDSSHLLVQVNAADTYRTDGGFYITVWNPGPGGGYSNAVFFAVAYTPALRQAPAPNNVNPVSYNAPAYNPNYNTYYNPYANTGANVYSGYNTANVNYNTPAPGNYYDPNAPYKYPVDPNAPANVQTGYTANNLAANAVYGTNSFLPSGIIQWVLFAIFVLVIVILVRRVSGARERYHAAPLKHS